jgi:hypothetical protein
MPQLIQLADLLDTARHGRRGTIREAVGGEAPHFLQDHDKLCTGMVARLPSGAAFSFNLDPPMMLKAGRGYIIEACDP